MQSDLIYHCPYAIRSVFTVSARLLLYSGALAQLRDRGIYSLQLLNTILINTWIRSMLYVVLLMEGLDKTNAHKWIYEKYHI